MKMYAYETKYGSPEAAAVKAAGAKWNGNWKVWESPTEVPGVPVAQPDHRKVYKNADRFYPQAFATVKLIQALANGPVDEEKLTEFCRKLDDGSYVGRCCLAAIELYLAAVTAGIDTRSFWNRPASEIEAEIEAAD